ncbi:major royal jelly protein 1-like [Pecten maximus]|uniref:major royal jelly protein 1-like n=1 Tax=Pecten maximus TaxID=6579 RepID=UPI0014583ADC|nr:major royal jelly protein 1-like [Pecten maximus]
MVKDVHCPLLFVFLVAAVALVTVHGQIQSICTDSRIMHKFVTLDYDWPNDTAKDSSIANEEYIVNNNIISGMKVYDDNVYVTVPRWRRGVPSTLNKVIVRNGESILQPFPSWEVQKIGDCRALQYVQSMEIDPNTGWMWIIDTGRINFFAADGTPTQNLCPAKIIVYDIKNSVELTRYEFPNEVAERETTFLNDIVIQYVNDESRYAYISDALAFRMVVYDRVLNTSHYFSHPASMEPEPGNGNITILGETLPVSAGINGMALSWDMKYVYYGPVSGYSLYRVPTSVASQPGGNFAGSVRKVGNKPSQAAGMAYSKNDFLYFPALGENAIYRWDIKLDMTLQNTDIANVEMKALTRVLQDDQCMVFVDILNFNNDGSLWFSVNKLNKFLLTSMDFTGNSGANVLIWKVPIGDTGYLDRTAAPTEPPVTDDGSNGADITSSPGFIVYSFLTLVLSVFFSRQF